MSLIWATRGLTWGFRFLLKGDLRDPLQEYEEAFASTDSDQELCRPTGDTVALRFPDPEGRTDTAGRVIPHDFVISGPLAAEIDSVNDGRRLIWSRPEISRHFAEIWDTPKPPPLRG